MERIRMGIPHLQIRQILQVSFLRHPLLAVFLLQRTCIKRKMNVDGNLAQAVTMVI